MDCRLKQVNFSSHQRVCQRQETQWDMSAQILALAPAPLVSLMTAESSCCKQVWGMHIDTCEPTGQKQSTQDLMSPNETLIISDKEQTCTSCRIIVELDQNEGLFSSRVTNTVQ